MAPARNLHVIIHVIEVLLSQNPEEMLLSGILDAGNQFTEFPVSIIHLIRTRPEITLLMQALSVAHIDEGC